jgi:hypothetical protein
MQGNGSRPTHWLVEVLVGAGDITDCANLRGVEATRSSSTGCRYGLYRSRCRLPPRVPTPTSLTVMRRPGAITKRARAPQSAIMSTVQRMPPVMFDISARRRVSPERLLQLRSRCLAHRGHQQQLRASRRLRSRLAAGAMAAQRPCRASLVLHVGPLAPSGVQRGLLPRTRNASRDASYLASAEVGAEIVVNGHEHNCERLARRIPTANRPIGVASGNSSWERAARTTPC